MTGLPPPKPRRHRLGPFASEAEAMSEALAWPTGQPTREPSPERNLTILMDVLIAAEVDLGTYDQRIVEWLTRWEPQTVVVIAGLIWRARSRDQQASEPESPDAE